MVCNASFQIINKITLVFRIRHTFIPLKISVFSHFFKGKNVNINTFSKENVRGIELQGRYGTMGAEAVLMIFVALAFVVFRFPNDQTSHLTPSPTRSATNHQNSTSPHHSLFVMTLIFPYFWCLFKKRIRPIKKCQKSKQTVAPKSASSLLPKARSSARRHLKATS